MRTCEFFTTLLTLNVRPSPFLIDLSWKYRLKPATDVDSVEKQYSSPHDAYTVEEVGKW